MFMGSPKDPLDSNHGFSGFSVHNLGVLIRNNFFENNDTGALSFAASHDIQVWDNAILDNYNNGWDCSGGVINVDPCGQGVDFQRNFLWNRNVYDVPSICSIVNRPSQPWMNNIPADRRVNTYGFELFGKNITVQNNWVEYFTHEGIYAASVNSLNVTSNRIRNNSRTFHALDSTITFDDDPARVMIANSAPIGTTYRPVNNVSITGNEIGNIWNIYQSYGVRLRISIGNSGATDTASPPEVMTNITIGPNSLRNRLGDACNASGVQFSPANFSIQPCNNALRYNVSACTTSGCQY